MAEWVPEQSQMPLGRECCFSACCKAMWSSERTRLRRPEEIKDVFLRGSPASEKQNMLPKKNPRLVGVCEIPRQAGWWRFLAARGRSGCPGRCRRWCAEQHFTWCWEVCQQAKAQTVHELVCVLSSEEILLKETEIQGSCTVTSVVAHVWGAVAPAWEIAALGSPKDRRQSAAYCLVTFLIKIHYCVSEL